MKKLEVPPCANASWRRRYIADTFRKYFGYLQGTNKRINSAIYPRIYFGYLSAIERTALSFFCDGLITKRQQELLLIAVHMWEERLTVRWYKHMDTDDYGNYCRKFVLPKYRRLKGE